MIAWKRGPRHQGKLKTKKARFLRSVLTDAERRLWRVLRNRELGSLKFRRQVPFGAYYLDFYCAERKIAVELDGSQHLTLAGRQRDMARTSYLNGQGVRVLRYSDRDVLLDTEAVIQDLARKLNAVESSPLPSPLQGEGEA